MIFKKLLNRERKTKNVFRVLDQEIINEIKKIGFVELKNNDADVKTWIPGLPN